METVRTVSVKVGVLRSSVLSDVSGEKGRKKGARGLRVIERPNAGLDRVAVQSALRVTRLVCSLSMLRFSRSAL